MSGAFSLRRLPGPLRILWGALTAESVRNPTEVLVIGRECWPDPERQGELRPEWRYIRILEKSALTSAQMKGAVIITPGGFLRGNPLSHGEIAKRYLVEELGVPAEYVRCPADGIPPATTTHEEVQTGIGRPVRLVCEAAQVPRVVLLMWAMGYRVPITIVWGWNGMIDLAYQGALTVTAFFDPDQTLLNQLGVVSRLKGDRAVRRNRPLRASEM